MKAVITVIGIDRIGVIAGVSAVLLDCMVNIEDISQTTMQGYFMMHMIVDISKMNVPFQELSDRLAAKGKELGMDVRVQKDEIFRAMHSI